jgi:propionate CoA-transferase
MAEADRDGNVNVSKFGTRIAGPGGFINISQAAKEVYFLGLFRAGAKLAIEDGAVQVVAEGPHCKLRERVDQITFSGDQARRRGQTVFYITERCVLRLTAAGLEITEIAPGLDLERDVLGQMQFRPAVSPALQLMDPAIFRPELMDLRHRPPVPMEDRFVYDPEANLLFCNFEGLVLETPEQATALAEPLDAAFRGIGRRVNVIVNYDNFDVLPPARPLFFAMVERNEQYVLTRTRYSTNAFFRRRLGNQFACARLEHRLYGSFADARAGLGTDSGGHSLPV